jgi:hypothetical protein
MKEIIISKLQLKKNPRYFLYFFRAKKKNPFGWPLPALLESMRDRLILYLTSDSKEHLVGHIGFLAFICVSKALFFFSFLK